MIVYIRPLNYGQHLAVLKQMPTKNKFKIAFLGDKNVGKSQMSLAI